MFLLNLKQQEIFTLYIMGLKQLWLYHQRAPYGWDYRKVIQQLDDLEDIITHEFRKISHVFGHPRVIVPSYSPIIFDIDI